MSDTDPSEPTPPAEADLVELATKLFALARAGDTDTLAAYVEAGVPVNLSNDKGDTLVMLAAYHGHPATVAMLMERGADADRLNDRGQSPIAGAVFKGEDAVVAVLVDHGADPRIGTPTAVDAARMFDKPHLLELFGATPEA
ncbi:ankyrin repeat domain-containing protein [Spiractinospora alimapuensis]|uniref:ankyrin repeat domain-containing protein n=1 Tax=Spiractinospora alimapuensis TaxID=2820884 RepID=UPI001F45EFC7|nr:ankyrin repeat domain-containing protein [Spiractinospora alimapuensis]QVQ52575.1 ankyrin repeat domain-containing protein [Spiractinospora alimapuensis]